MAWRDGRHPVQVWIKEEDYKALRHWAIDNDTGVSRWLLEVAEKKAEKLAGKQDKK